MEDLWDDIMTIIQDYPIEFTNDALVTKWSGIMSSTRRIVNSILTKLDHYTISCPGGSDSDEPDIFYSAREHGDEDVSDNDSTEEDDDCKVDANDSI